MKPFRLSAHSPVSRFIMPGYCTWGGSMIRHSDGACHLYVSAWPGETGFPGWVTHSLIAHAVSDNPLGPFTFQNIVLGKQEINTWDRDVAHNPHVLQADGKIYLYYMGNRGNGEYWSHRNNQCIGVAVADNPGGPFERWPEPVLPPGQEGTWDDLMTSNPSCARGPDGRFVMIYKGASRQGEPPRYGAVNYGVAFSDSPTGPFKKQLQPIFESGDASFAAEDPFLWYQNDRFFCMVKDMGRNFSSHERALVLFSSEDAIHWELEASPVVTTREIHNQDGTCTQYDRVERPQLYLENHQPAVLFLAVKPGKDSDDSWNIHIPVEF